MDDPRLRELDEMAKDPDVDGSRMFDTVMAVGSDLPGLRVLVDRYGYSDHPLLPVHVAMALSRAAWAWEPADTGLCDVVLDFIEAAGKTTHPGALTTMSTALKGLNASRTLRIGDVDRQAVVGRFLLHCLDQRHFMAPGDCVEFLSEVWADGTLERVVAPSLIAALKERLARLAAEAGDEVGEELASLRQFWESQ